jgi:DNA-directed RNA polymerase specialized sigma24 family protein
MGTTGMVGTLSHRDSTLVALCRRIQNTGQFRRQKRSETKTETKVELLFCAERSKIADLRAGYANRADFSELLERNLKPLYLLAFLLTANHKDAERCFSMTAKECLEEQAVFKEWAQSWIRRSLIKNAIGVVSPASRRDCEKREFWSVEQNEAERNDEINALTRLPHLERFVFVMSILERYSDWECSVLLGCSIKKLAQPRMRGLRRLPGLLTLFSRLSPEHDVLSGGLR